MSKDNQKCAGMVDVSSKDSTLRTAKASGRITFSKAAFDKLVTGGSPKGNVLEYAKVAGIMAVKSTPSIIPLCHPLEIGKAFVDCQIDKPTTSVIITAEVSYLGKTGVEMEALHAVTAAALTIYDMMKWSGQDMIISDIKLMAKTGGKKGDYQRKE